MKKKLNDAGQDGTTAEQRTKDDGLTSSPAIAKPNVSRSAVRKIRHHEISVGELQDWLTKEEVVFASSSRERKRLVCSLNGGMKVLVAGQIVWQGIQPFSAVEAYNAIEDKYIDPSINFELSIEKQVIWEDACNTILKDIANTFLSKSNQNKAGLQSDKDVFQAIGETIQNFPIPKYYEERLDFKTLEIY